MSRSRRPVLQRRAERPGLDVTTCTAEATKPATSWSVNNGRGVHWRATPARTRPISSTTSRLTTINIRRRRRAYWPTGYTLLDAQSLSYTTRFMGQLTYTGQDEGGDAAVGLAIRSKRRWQSGTTLPT
jgi:hypothetical protein